MRPDELWQNFKLGEEQEIACNFIYDAIRNLNEMETLSLETEVFPVLYNLSIGIERLLKVAIVLVEYNNDLDIDDFEKSLITHNHMDLYNRLKQNNSLKFGKAHIELLSLLSNFYKSHRYDRFSLQSARSLAKEKIAFHTYLNKYLKIDLLESFPFVAVWNTISIKKFVGRVVKKIAKEVYNVIESAADRKNIYTYEISGSDSKAAKVLFGGAELNFEDEERVAIEILIYLINSKDVGLINFIKDVEPLELDPALAVDYFQFLLPRKSGRPTMIKDEIESLYEDLNISERLKIVDAIRDPLSSFDEDPGE